MSGRTVGVLGGMGPAATWDFCNRLLAVVPAARDQDHLRVLVDSDPSLPDRNAAILNEGPSPARRLAEMARGLERAGAELLCMPCNAAHAYADAVRGATDVPFVDMIAATAAAVAERAPGARRVAVLATRGTLHARLYEDALAAYGTTTSPVDEERLRDLMEIVTAVKAGDASERVRTRAKAVAHAFVEEGAEVVVAACTEVPLVLSAEDVPVPWVASSDALAQAVAERATHTARDASGRAPSVP